MKKMRYTVTTWEILAEVDKLMAKREQWTPQRWVKRTVITTYDAFKTHLKKPK